MISVEFAPTRGTLRVDERYDTAGGAFDANDPQAVPRIRSRHKAPGDSHLHFPRREIGITRQRFGFRPGLVGNLLGKRAYRHTDNDATPNATYDYVYVYDAVGNLYVVLNDEGGEEYAFSQDAWGNELSIGSFQGTVRPPSIPDHRQDQVRGSRAISIDRLFGLDRLGVRAEIVPRVGVPVKAREVAA
ncbi:MAG: hypothetical protein GHCLOJNM_02344 [bacterium]|nr:hypothetical protein [bacterium]